MKIKTFTLMTLALLVSVMSFAQKSKVILQDDASFKVMTKLTSQKVSMVSPEGISAFTHKAATSKPSTSGISFRRADVVTLPDGVEVLYYKLSGGHSRVQKGNLTRTVKVVYDGDDVYVSGLSFFIPDAFVKGTFIDETTVVFDKWQYCGSYSFSDGDADIYFAGTSSGDPEDCEAKYDAENDVFTFTNYPAEFYSMDEDFGLTSYWKPGTTITKIDGEVELPVEIPSDLVTEDYSYIAQDYFDEKEVSWSVKVGFYNEDVYIQGLSSVLPKAWVKGVLANGVVTIPNQLLGTYGTSELYFVAYDGKGVANSYFLNYDAKTGNFTEGDNAYMINLYKDKIDHSVYEFMYDVKINKIIEKAATPANPSFANMQFTPKGDKIETKLAVVDTDGNGLATDKLFYKLYSDVKDELGLNATITFTKELYPTLEEDMEEIPYGFEDADFANGVVMLRMEHADWKKIGLQSIYKGGGETHESEIVWYNIPWPIKTTLPEGMKVTVNDFVGTEADDGEDVEFSTSLNIAVDGNDLYIQGLAADAGIEDTWVKGTKGDDGVYTFALGQDLGATSSYRLFLLGYDDSEGTVVEPKIEVDEKAGVYKFVNCFLVNATYTDRSYYYSHFHANSTIAIKGESNDPVVAPEGLVVEDYTYQGTDYFAKEGEDPIVKKSVKIGFYGDDVYMQGIAGPYMPEAWIKGKKDGNKITFRTGQQLGAYSSTTTLWFRSFSPDMTRFEDAVFTYDAETGILTTDNYLSIAATKSAGDNFIIDFDVTISKVVEKAATPSAPSFGNLAYYPNGSFIEFNIPTVDVNGEGMLSNKLSYQLFSKDAEGNIAPITFTKDLYEKLEADMQEIPYGFTDKFDFYEDAVYLNMDFSKWSQLGLQVIYKGGGETNTSEVVWYDIVYPYNAGILPEGLIAKAADFKGTQTSTDAVTEFTKSVNIAQKDNLIYIQGVANEDEGENAKDSWIIGEKGENDTYIFSRGALLGSTNKYIFFLMGYDDATNKSEDVKMQLDKENKVLKLVNNLIVNASYIDRLYYSNWYNAGSTIDASSILDGTGINAVKNEVADAVAPAFNLAGQRVNSGYKGLVIKNGRKVVMK